MRTIFSLFICLLLGTAFLTGCTDTNEPYTQKSYIPDSAVSAVCINVRDREVIVTPSADGQIRIDYFENSKEFYDISISEDHVLTMTAVSNKEWTDFIGGKASGDVRKISLQMPDALLKSLKISTTNEDISVSALTLSESVSFSANGGNITFEKLYAGNEVVLDVKNGNISGTVSGSYDDYAITCDIKKGKSNLPAKKEGGSKKLLVTANNGDVEIDIE